MSDRQKDMVWSINKENDGRYSTTAAQLAVMQDIRDELKRLNLLLHCENFVQIPSILRAIRRKLPAPKPMKRRKS